MAPNWMRILYGCLALASTAHVAAASPAYSAKVKPVLQQYCYDCHGDGMDKGNITLDHWKTDAEALNDRASWLRVIQVLERGEMPPKDKQPVPPEERAQLVATIEKDLLGCDCEHPDPGRVTLRRLNRAEYNNTVRELLGVDFQPAADFPVDASGYGFDTIGDVLSLPPILLEKYLAAADKIVDAALGLNQATVPESRRLPVDLLEVGYNAKQRGDGWVALNSVEEDDVAVAVERTTRADYVVRVHAYARQETTNAIKLTFMLDKTPVRTVPVATNASQPGIYEARVTVPPGKHRLRAVVRRNKEGLSDAEALRWKAGPLQKGAVYLEWMEIDGPHAPATAVVATVALPSHESGGKQARTFLRDFLQKAYRRPVTYMEVEKYLELAKRAWDRGSSYEEGFAVAIKAALISPHFLFRGRMQTDPGQARTVQPISEFALASRLSYFIWSSMPDAELFREAENQTLRRNLEQQVHRMLKDPRSKALIDHFGGQWLHFRLVDLLQPDEGTYRFDESLREAMKQETWLFFENIIREDRSILEFLTADYTFVNERLAKHYALQGITGAEFQRVSLAGTPRRGVLTHASVLALTSNPTRTSPVKRGKWVLENLLNAPPPPPPPDVPELKDSKEHKGTLRQRLEEHRDNPLCASCHARMDPIGFGLENFDGVGAWRTTEGDEPIDTSGELTTGEKFRTAHELIRILSTSKKDQFVQCVVDKMLTYALGRGMEHYDRCAIKQISADLARDGYRFSALVLAITKSAPFQQQRGEKE